MKQLILYMFLMLSAFADEMNVMDLDRFNIHLNVDRDGNVNPKVTVPIDWGGRFYSAVGYTSMSTIDHSDFGEAYAPSKYVTAGNSQFFWLDVIGSNVRFEKSYLSYSFTVGYREMTIVQYGYLHYHNPDTMQKETMAVDRTTDMKTYSVGLYLDYTYKRMFDLLSFRVSSHLFPYSYMTSDETMAFMPLVPEPENVKSSGTQDVSYDLNLDLLIDLLQSVSLGLSARYEYLPFKQDTLVAREDAYAFKVIEYQSNATTKTVGLRLLFSRFDYFGIQPMLGYERSLLSVETVYGSSASTETTKSNNYLFGFEKKY